MKILHHVGLLSISFHDQDHALAWEIITFGVE